MYRFTIAFLLSISPLVSMEINQNGDFQIWNRYFLVNHINPQWMTYSITEFRWGANASKFYYAYLQSQVFYTPRNWLSFGLGYRQAWRIDLPSDNWKLEYSPVFDTIWAIHFAGWEIRDRNRVQYVVFGSDPAHWVYRNRFRFVAPPFFENPKMTFFTDNEFFWRQTLGINEDRLSAGFMIQLRDCVASEIYYMARFLDAEPNWVYNTALNLVILFSF